MSSRDEEYGSMAYRIIAAEKRTNELMVLAKSEAQLLGYYLSWQLSGELMMRELGAPRASKVFAWVSQPSSV